jgi:hypothetical protein
VAPCSHIDLIWEYGEYKIFIACPAVKLLEPVMYRSAKLGIMQRARYTILDKPKAAREVGKLRSLTEVGSALTSIP